VVFRSRFPDLLHNFLNYLVFCLNTSSGKPICITIVKGVGRNHVYPLAIQLVKVTHAPIIFSHMDHKDCNITWYSSSPMNSFDMVINDLLGNVVQGDNILARHLVHMHCHFVLIVVGGISLYQFRVVLIFFKFFDFFLFFRLDWFSNNTLPKSGFC